MIRSGRGTAEFHAVVGVLAIGQLDWMAAGRVLMVFQGNAVVPDPDTGEIR